MNKILFYYSIVLSAVIFIGSIFFMPKIINFALAGAFLPIVLYFWVAVTEPGEIDFPRWSFRFLIVIAILTSLGILAYSSFRYNLPEKETETQAEGNLDELKNSIDKLASGENSEDNKTLIEALSGIQNDLTAIKSELQKTNTILGITSSIESPQPTQTLNLNDEVGFVVTMGSTDVSVYLEPELSSALVGSLKPGIKYPFFKKQGSWYQVLLPDDKEGWVNQNKVKESN